MSPWTLPITIVEGLAIVESMAIVDNKLGEYSNFGIIVNKSSLSQSMKMNVFGSWDNGPFKQYLDRELVTFLGRPSHSDGEQVSSTH